MLLDTPLWRGAFLATMPSAQANKIAFQVARAVLGAAHSFDVAIEGTLVHVAASVQSSGSVSEVSASRGVEGIDESTDGLWPPAVGLLCNWRDGAVHLELLLDTPRSRGQYEGHLAFHVVTIPSRRQLVWINLTKRIQDTLDAHQSLCSIPANLSLWTRTGESDVRLLTDALTKAASNAGLSSKSTTQFHILNVPLPVGGVLPTPEEAFEKLVTTALVKLPFVTRAEANDVKGSPPFDIQAERTGVPVVPVKPRGDDEVLSPHVAESAGAPNNQGPVHLPREPAFADMDPKATIEKKTKGPAFLRFVAPLVDALKDMGGSARAGDVTDRVISRVGLGKDELAETTTNGQSRARNQIGWARFYLCKAGLLHGSQHGVWALTAKGREAALDEDGAVFQLFQGVRKQFKKLVDETDWAGPLPEEEDEELTEAGATVADPGEAGVEAEKDDDGSEAIHSPYDPSKTHIVTKPMSVEQLAKRLRYDEIDLAPDFQRKADLWTNDKKSRLIESMLIRIPLPVFYFDATDETKWLVVDGLQRLSTIRHFMVGDDLRRRLRLQGLEYLHQHNGKSFEELPRDLQRRIEETQIFAHLIQPGTPIEVKFNIFKRINTSGLILTAQEIRHALYQKKGGRKEEGAPHFLHELSDSQEFRDATDGAIDTERMLDCEFVLRFISFTLTPYTQYTEANMDGFLNRHMQRLNDEGEGPVRDDVRRRFGQAMRGARAIFGKDAFRKRFAANERRKPINKALFEVWSVALGNLDLASVEALVNRQEAVRSALTSVLREDREFEAAISQGTRDVKRVYKRFSTIENIIQQVLRGAS